MIVSLFCFPNEIGSLIPFLSHSNFNLQQNFTHYRMKHISRFPHCTMLDPTQYIKIPTSGVYPVFPLPMLYNETQHCRAPSSLCGCSQKKIRPRTSLFSHCWFIVHLRFGLTNHSSLIPCIQAHVSNKSWFGVFFFFYLLTDNSGKPHIHIHIIINAL